MWAAGVQVLRQHSCGPRWTQLPSRCMLSKHSIVLWFTMCVFAHGCTQRLMLCGADGRSWRLGIHTAASGATPRLAAWLRGRCFLRSSTAGLDSLLLGEELLQERLVAEVTL